MIQGGDDSIHKKSFSFATGPSVVAMLFLFSGYLNLRLGRRVRGQGGPPYVGRCDS